MAAAGARRPLPCVLMARRRPRVFSTLDRSRCGESSVPAADWACSPRLVRGSNAAGAAAPVDRGRGGRVGCADAGPAPGRDVDRGRSCRSRRARRGALGHAAARVRRRRGVGPHRRRRADRRPGDRVDRQGPHVRQHGPRADRRGHRGLGSSPGPVASAVGRLDAVSRRAGRRRSRRRRTERDRPRPRRGR